MKKRVEAIDPKTLQPVPLATFDLVGDRIVAEYLDDHYRDMLELNGIYTMETGEVRPRDGKRFFDALDRAYSRSTFRRVVVVP